MLYDDLIRRFDLFLFDMDGTLVVGDTPLPGAVSLVSALHNAGKTIRYITNNTLHAPAFHAARLSRAGIKAHADHIVTPLPALLAYVRARGITNAHVIASEDVVQALGLDPNAAPQAVILGLCQNWDYAGLQRACNLVAGGLPVIVCQPDPYCPDTGGNIPDSGALLALIETTLCRKIEVVVMGKPSAHMVTPILNNTGIPRDRTVLFGDRLHTDMALADACGVQGILVLTGQTKRSDITDDMGYVVVESLNSLL